MILTEQQQAQLCPTCVATSGAPGRYCARLCCYCGHEDCPAFESFVPRKTPSLPSNVTPLIQWKKAS